MYKGFVLAAAAAGSMSTHGPLLHVPPLSPPSTLDLSCLIKAKTLQKMILKLHRPAACVQKSNLQNRNKSGVTPGSSLQYLSVLLHPLWEPLYKIRANKVDSKLSEHLLLKLK